MSPELRAAIDSACEAGRRYSEAKKYLPLAAQMVLLPALDKARHVFANEAIAVAKKETS